MLVGIDKHIRYVYITEKNIYSYMSLGAGCIGYNLKTVQVQREDNLLSPLQNSKIELEKNGLSEGWEMFNSEALLLKGEISVRT